MGKTLVTYFSPTGTTKKAAQKISAITGADLYEIRPAVTYTTADLEWQNKKSRSSVEMSNPSSRPACEEHLAGVVIDRFGKDIMMIPHGDHIFTVTVLVSVSPQFFGWITGIGSGIRIAGPAHVQAEYREYLGNVLKLYE